MSLVPLLSLGFALGVAHATDADHVIAVSTLVGERSSATEGAGFRARAKNALRSAVEIGSFWGLGHTLTVLALGGLIIAFRWTMPPALEQSLELCVAIMLIGLGLWGVRQARAAHAAPAKVRRPLRSAGVGMVHGLAGSAAVALAVLSQTKDAETGVAYLAIFGLGTVLGMTLITSVLAMPFSVALRKQPLMRWIRLGGASVSALFGVLLFLKIGFVDGLFR